MDAGGPHTTIYEKQLAYLSEVPKKFSFFWGKEGILGKRQGTKSQGRMVPDHESYHKLGAKDLDLLQLDIELIRIYKQESVFVKA